MASTQAIAELRANALERLNTGFQKLADVTGVEAPVITVRKQERDPLFAQAKMLETLADWMDAHVEQIAPAPKGAGKQADDTSGDVFPLNAQYDDMTNKELRALAEERGIATNALRSKAELIDALLAADGFTEDEQAQMDAMSDEPDGEAS